MLIIDAFAFCRHGEQQSGKSPLHELTRLRSECASDNGEIEWALSGQIAKGVDEQISGYSLLRLAVKGVVQLKCQRCLTPFNFQINSNSTMLLAKDEHAADQLDALLQDGEWEASDGAEVIVGTKTFDVMALIEDEALLALPISAKHEVCPGEIKTDKTDVTVEKTAKRDSPFAALKDQVAVGKPTKKSKN